MRRSLSLAVLVLGLVAATASAVTPVTLKPPKRVYAGYPAWYTVETKDFDGDDVRLERRVGGSWKPLTTEPHRDAVELLATLPGGRQTIRAVVIGRQATLASASRPIVVRKPRTRATSAGDDGAYASTTKQRFAATVAGGGRTLKKLSTTLSAFCIGPTLYDNYVSIAFAAIESAPIAPDGTVSDRERYGKGTIVDLHGRVENGRLRGEISVSFSTCSGGTDFSAKRKRTR